MKCTIVQRSGNECYQSNHPIFSSTLVAGCQSLIRNRRCGEISIEVLGGGLDTADDLCSIKNNEGMVTMAQTDNLTGVGNLDGLSDFLVSELHGLALTSKPYQDRFLCCDIDDFRSYVDCHGFQESDQALVELASCLKSAGLEVYRFAGDGFVARSATAPLKDLMKHRELTIRQAMVEINLPLNRQRLHRCRSWILAHLQLGIVQPKILGDAIKCIQPKEWERTLSTN
jgi:diguanylate cyclase (GGDEF)-like protein